MFPMQFQDYIGQNCKPCNNISHQENYFCHQIKRKNKKTRYFNYPGHCSSFKRILGFEYEHYRSGGRIQKCMRIRSL